MTWTKLWFLEDSLYQGRYVIISLVSKEIRREGDNIAVRQSHYDLAILSLQSSFRRLLDYRYPGDLLLCPVLPTPFPSRASVMIAQGLASGLSLTLPTGMTVPSTLQPRGPKLSAPQPNLVCRCVLFVL